MIIGLFGFDFISSNKGCEALTYTFLSMMERICDEKKLYVYNFTYNKTLVKYINAIAPQISGGYRPDTDEIKS